MRTQLAAVSAVLCLLATSGCSSPNPTSTSALKTQPNVQGTVFTIVFENENSDAIIGNPAMPFFNAFSQQNGSATQYASHTHPSLPNYIELTSGATNGVNNDNDPTYAVKVFGNQNLPDQLDAAGIKWRAYMESMGTPCRMTSGGGYSAHHNPFLYYTSIVDDPARCNDRVVDYDQHFAEDLASNAYRYMWITPNMCDNMHDCAPAVADHWLETTVKAIQESPGYKNGGAIFVLFDEGSLRIFGAGANLATIVASPNLVAPSYTTATVFDHRSYVATVEDIFGLPRLPTTESSASMDEFFTTR
jgi:hypothetical protein